MPKERDPRQGKTPRMTPPPGPARSSPVPPRRMDRPRARPSLPSRPARPRRNRALPIGIAAGAALILAAFLAAVGLRRRPLEGPPPSPSRPAAQAPAPSLPPPRPEPAPKAEPARPAPPAEPKPPPAPAPSGPEAEFRARLEARRNKALERVAEIRREIEEEKKAAEQAARALRDRLSRHPFRAALRSGETHEGAVIRDFSFTDVELEAGGKRLVLPWDALSSASVLAAADVLYDADRAEGQFERGRFLVARRLWKEALAAFQSAVKLDENLQAKVDEIRDLLERLVSGRGFFRGAARRVGPDGLALTYDWKDPEQAADFTPPLRIEGGAAVLPAGKTKIGTALQGIEFVEEVDLDLTLTAPGKTSIYLFAREEAFELEIGPDTAALFRVLPNAPAAADRRRELARARREPSPRDKPVEVRLTAREGELKLFLDRREALAYAAPAPGGDSEPLKGRVGFAAEGGPLRIAAPLAIRGRVDPEDLEKRFAEIEALARRAHDPDLQDIRMRRIREQAEELLGGRSLTLTADDPYFILRMPSRELTEYDRIKQASARKLPLPQKEREIRASLDRLIAAYPDVPSLYYLRALLHLERQDPERVRADVEKAIDLFPDFAEALALRARIRDAAGDHDGASQDCLRALEILPDCAPAYILRAVQTFRRNRGAPGEPWADDLRLAARLDPSSRDPQIQMRLLRYAARGPRDLGCRFEAATEHYRVLTDIGPQASEQYAARLEAAWRHFAETFRDVPRNPSAPPPRVVVFRAAENYFTYSELLSEQRGEHTMGVYRSGLNELVLFEQADLEATYRNLHHEQFHHFTGLMVRRPLPYWFNEGLAEYMAGLSIRDGRVVETGRILKDRLRMIQIGLSAGVSIPFERIMRESPGEFYSGPVAFKYAQAWSMVHFFFEHQKGRYRGLIDRYFADLRAGRTAEEAFDAVFREKAAELQREWAAYVKALRA